MKYDIEQIHNVSGGRRSGKSVTAIMEIIGSILVTDNASIPFIIRKREWASHLRPMFEDIARDHFGETVTRGERFVWSIKGYTSKVHVFSLEQWQDGRELRAHPNVTEPIYDCY